MSSNSYKITVVGDGFVGKTSMLLRYTQNITPGEYVPTVFENYAGTILVDGHEYSIQLMDTSGQEDYERIRRLSYFNVDCFLVCFCVDSIDSLNNIKLVWLPEIKKKCGAVKFVLVGTKSDLRQKYPYDCVDNSAINKFKNKIKARAYVECSSVTKDGIDEVFETAVKIILNRNIFIKDKCVLL